MYSIFTIQKRLRKFGIKKRNTNTEVTENQPDKRNEEWLTTADISRKYKAHINTVQDWVKGGKFPNAQFKIEGIKRYWLVPASDLAGFVPRRKGPQPKPNPSLPAVLKRAQQA